MVLLLIHQKHNTYIKDIIVSIASNCNLNDSLVFRIIVTKLRFSISRKDKIGFFCQKTEILMRIFVRKKKYL